MTDVESGGRRYGYTIHWLHAKSFAKGGLMILPKDDIRVEAHHLVPLTLPLDGRVVRLMLQLPFGGWVTLMNVHVLNPAADGKVFWEELMPLGTSGTCIMAGDMKSLCGVQDADYTPVWSKTKKTAMPMEQDLVDDGELQDAWPLTRSRNETREGYMRCHVRLGGDMVQRQLDKVYVPLRWVGAMSHVQLVHMELSDHQAAMTMFTPEYMPLPPRTCLPTWMLEDKELMEAWAQGIGQQRPPFPDSKPGNVHNNKTSGIMQWQETNDRTTNLAAVRDIQPMAEEQATYALWDQLDAVVWGMAERTAKERPAPREVQHLRRLHKAVKDSSVTRVANAGYRMVREYRHEDVPEEQAFYCLRALRDSARYTQNLTGGGGGLS